MTKQTGMMNEKCLLSLTRKLSKLNKSRIDKMVGLYPETSIIDNRREIFQSNEMTLRK